LLLQVSKICFSDYETVKLDKVIESLVFVDATGRIKTEQEENDIKEEVVVSSNRGQTTAAESKGRKLNLGKRAAKESQSSKRTEKVVRARSDYAGASSSTAAAFTILFKQGYLVFLVR